MGTNSWPSGLSRWEPWAPTFSWSTTGSSQPSDGKYDMSVNGFDGVEEEAEEEEEEEEEEGGVARRSLGLPSTMTRRKSLRLCHSL